MAQIHYWVVYTIPSSGGMDAPTEQMLGIYTTRKAAKLAAFMGLYELLKGRHDESEAAYDEGEPEPFMSISQAKKDFDFGLEDTYFSDDNDYFYFTKTPFKG